MTAPHPAGLAEQIEALKAEKHLDVDDPASPLAFARRLTNELLDLVVDHAIALCAEAWGKELARLEDFTRCAMAAGGQQVSTISAQAARIAELEKVIGELAEPFYLPHHACDAADYQNIIDEAGRRQKLARAAIKEPS